MVDFIWFVIFSGVFILIIWLFIKNRKDNKRITAKIKASKKILYKIEEMDCVVAGSQFDSSNGVPREIYIEDLQEYDPLELLPEPTNEVDKNAVLVLANGKDIGYVPTNLSKRITDYLNSGYKLESYVKKTYKKDKYLNCVIVIESYEEK